MEFSSSAALVLDTFSTVLCQSGYIIQKKGHTSVETHNALLTSDQTKKSGFFTCQWHVGFALTMLAGLGHILALPFANIVLLSLNSGTAIVVQVVLALIFLNEVLICKYDLPALLLIIMGSCFIVLTANFEEKAYSVEELRDQVSSIKSIVYFSFSACLLYTTLLILKWMRSSVAQFEIDVEEWLLTKKATTSGSLENDRITMGELGDNRNQSQRNGHAGQRRESRASNVSVASDDDAFYAQVSVKPTDPRRPARVLIQLIDKCPAEFVSKMSPESKRLKDNLKMPMVLLCWCCGMINGIGLCSFKIAGETLNREDGSANLFFGIVMASFGLISAATNIYCLNLSMKYYNNIDVMPIYQAMLLMFMLIAGLLILDEMDFYTWGELALLSGSALFVILGIYVLTKKQNLVMVKDQEDQVAKGHQTYFVADEIDAAVSQMHINDTLLSNESTHDLKESLLPLESEDADDLQLREQYYIEVVKQVFEEESYKLEAIQDNQKTEEDLKDGE